MGRRVPRTHLALRSATAVALALFSLPLLSLSAYAEGEEPAATEVVAAQEEPAQETPQEPPGDSGTVTEPEAEAPPADGGAPPDEGTAEEPAAEEPPAEEALEGGSPSAASDGTSVEVQGTSKQSQQLAAELEAVDPACKIATFSQNTQENMGGEWINGALNQNNSNYAEGDYVPQRVELGGLAPGDYTLQFEYERTKAGKYAYDFVDHLYISGSAGASIDWDTFTGPAPAPFAEFVTVTITFTIVADADDTATIGWDGHIASELDYGPNSGAGSINGAPYHFHLIDTDDGNGTFGCDTGGRDNQLMADAVDFGTIVVIKDAQPNSAEAFDFTVAIPDNSLGFDLVDDGAGPGVGTFSIHVPPGPVTVTETDMPEGWSLTDISCTDTAEETANSALVQISDDETVTCTFTNSRASTLTVDKYWVINGEPAVLEGEENPVLELSADLYVDDTLETFGDELTGYLQGGSATLAEDVDFGNPLCSWADDTVQGRVTDDNGDTPADGTLPYEIALDEVNNHAVITNRVWCDAELVLSKVVNNTNGGDALASAFTLVASPQSGGSDLTTPGSTDGNAFLVDPAETFDLSETGGPAGYTLTGITCANQPATTVKVPIGTSVECVFTNADSPGSLTLDKEADDNSTGDQTPDSAWTVMATSDIEGQDDITGDGFATATTKAGTYSLSEDGPDTYDEDGWDCFDSDTDADVPVNGEDEIQVGHAQNVYCVVTNTAIRPTLTLIKHVEDLGTGDTTGPEAFELTATPQPTDENPMAGQGDVAGLGGASEEVKVGDYLLSEDGPDTYVMDEEGWTCSVDGGESFEPEGDVVSVAVAQNVTCEVTNNAIPSSWMVEKDSDPGSGDTVEPGEEIHYTITLTKVGDGVDVHGVEVVDTLTGIDMDWISEIEVDGVPATVEQVTEGAGTLTWNVDVLGDTPMVLTYTVTVGEGAWDATLHNVITQGPVPCEPDADQGADDCDETTHYTPHFTLDKAVELIGDDGDGNAEPGEFLLYTLTMVNDTERAVLTDAMVTDDLTDVFDDATLVSSPALLADQGIAPYDDQGLVFDADGLTWTVATLNQGATAEAEYLVQIDEGAWGAELDNIALPTPGGPGECIPAGDVPGPGPDDPAECTTSTPTPEVTTMVVEKQDAESGAVLAGAEFELYLDANNPLDENGDCVFADPPVVDPDDELLGTSVTDGDGHALFPELQHGCYLLVETSAPPEYKLPDDPIMGIQIDSENFVGGGEMSPILVTDFGEGNLQIVAKRQFELVDGTWVESDGFVGFGDTVRYEVKVAVTGPRAFYNVKATDYVPGYNPDDTTSTVQGTLVPGSAVCEGNLACTVTVDEDNLVTFDIGDVAPALGETLFTTAVMEVVFPDLPAGLDLDPGETYEATLWNQGFLTWDLAVGVLEAAPRSGGGAAAGRVASLLVPAVEFIFESHSLDSNEVVVTASITARPRPPEKPDKPDKPDLPDTGMAAGLGSMAALGALMMAMGAALMRRRRTAQGDTLG